MYLLSPYIAMKWGNNILKFFYIDFITSRVHTLMITGNFGMFIDKQKNLHLSCKVLEPRDGECTEWIAN